MTTRRVADYPDSDMTKGDILVANGSGLLANLPVGSDDQVLTADSGESTGVKWATPATGYTTENAQDDVGNILTDSATIDFDYNDGGPSISADVIDNSITNAKLRQGGANSVIGRAANTMGNVADIQAGDDDQFLVTRGGTLYFDTLVASDVPGVKLDDHLTPDDNTDLNASATRHGLLPKLSNTASEFLTGTGTWVNPKLDDLSTPDDNTDLNASPSRHGLLKKLSNTATEYMDGTGNWSTPSTNFSPNMFGCRLSISSSDPYAENASSSSATIYLVPCIHNRMYLYSGSAWVPFTVTSVSLSMTASNGMYDVFLYDSSGLTMELVSWTNASTRATALATQDGIRVKTSASSRLYVGTVYITSNVTYNVLRSKRHVWNEFNRKQVKVERSDSTVHTHNTTSWRSWNNSTANAVEIVLGRQVEDVNINLYAQINSGGTGRPEVSFGVNVNTVENWGYVLLNRDTPTASFFKRFALSSQTELGIGLSTINIIERSSTANSQDFDAAYLQAELWQ